MGKLPDISRRIIPPSVRMRGYRLLTQLGASFDFQLSENRWEFVRQTFEEQGFKPLAEQLYDDGGKEVQTECIVRVKSTEDARRAVQIARQTRYGVMAIGSLTSAVGAFEAQKYAQLNGLEGFIGLQISPTGSLSATQNTELSDSQLFERVVPEERELRGMLELYRSNDPATNHRVRVWAGLTPGQINTYLVEELGFGHSVFLDLTTFDSAQIGAVICNGSEGPVRVNAKFNLKSLTFVNGHGKIVQLDGEDAAMQVGLGGTAGVVTEVVLDVIREGRNEFGYFLPLPGGIGKEYAGLVNYLPRVMSRLDQYAIGKFIEDDNGLKLEPLRGKVLLKGFEIITRRELRSTYAVLNDDSEERGRIGSLLENMRDTHCHVGLLINCTTDVSEDEMVDLLEALFEDSNDENNLFAEVRNLQRFKDVYRSVDYEDDSEEDVVYFQPSEIKALKRIREAIPEMTRSSKLNGFTTSTDVNCRITASDPDERKRAYKAIMETYWMYANDLRDRDFRIYTYGHMHPGDRERSIGGGIDPHVRASYFLEGEDEDKQKRAPEAFAYLKDRKKDLLKQLRALHGHFGIVLEPGEKRISEDYAKWLEESCPDVAETLYNYTTTHGDKTFGARSQIKLHAHPPRIEGGILNYFPKDPSADHGASFLDGLQRSILLWCQNSHRSAEGMRVVCETLGLIRDWLDLRHTERVFFCETPEKAVHTSLMSLVNYRKKKRPVDLRDRAAEEISALVDSDVQAVVLNDSTLLDHPALTKIKKVLVVQDVVKINALEREQAAVVVYSGEDFGCGGELGLIVTNLETVHHARVIAERNNIGYVHSIVEMNDKTYETIETPKLHIIAELGCLLAHKLGQRCTLSESEAATILDRQAKFLTLNPGPSQINQGVLTGHMVVKNKLATIANSRRRRRKVVHEVEDKLRRYFSIPSSHKIFFTGSATQAMEQIMESLAFEYSVIGIKGAFGERLFSVAKTFSTGVVKSVRLRWGEGENSQVKSIAAEMFSKLPANPKKRQTSRIGFFITAHETSTSVQTDIKLLSREFRALSQKNGLRQRPLQIVDGTSELGFTKPEFREIDVYFGSVQKFLGLPAGLGLIIVSPRAMQMAEHTEQNRTKDELARCYRTFPEMLRQKEEGRDHNLRAILQLGQALDDYFARGGIRALQKETQRKYEMLMGVLGANPHLAPVVQNLRDRSGVLIHLAGVDIEVRKLKEKVENVVTLGNGYGPYKGETLRLYLSPNVSDSQIRLVARALNSAIEDMVDQGETLDIKPPRRSRNLDAEWAALHGGISLLSRRRLQDLLSERIEKWLALGKIRV